MRRRVAVVLAAGKGTRMRSERPKVLHEAAGKPLLGWVLEAARGAGCKEILVIVGHGADDVRRRFDGQGIEWVVQAEQKGTGHALAQVAGRIDEPALLLVLSGDVPLLTPATLERLATAADRAWGAMAVAELDDPASLGRVTAREDGCLERIVEAADATAEQLAIQRINAGIYALPAPEIFTYLDRLQPANAQGELYLTDALSAAASRGIELVTLANADEALGVNSRADLALVHRRLLDRSARDLMSSGVTVLEPARTSIEPGVVVGADSIVHPEVSLLGRTAIGRGVTLHQGAWLRDTTIGDGASIGPYCVLDGVEVTPGETLVPLTRRSAPRQHS